MLYWWPLPAGTELPPLTRGCQTSEILKLDKRYCTHWVDHVRTIPNLLEIVIKEWWGVWNLYETFFENQSVLVYAGLPWKSPGHHQIFSVLPTFHVQWSTINKICELLQEIPSRLFWHLQEMLDLPGEEIFSI